MQFYVVYKLRKYGKVERKNFVMPSVVILCNETTFQINSQKQNKKTKENNIIAWIQMKFKTILQ